MKKVIVLAGGLGLALVGFAAEPSANAICWVDGTWDESGAPKGKLLTGNTGWWGARVKTGVTYEYEKDMAPTAPLDWDHMRGICGRFLLSGMYWHHAIREQYAQAGYDCKPAYHFKTVGAPKGRTISAIFDFNRPMVFNEIDVLARGTSNGVTKIAFSEDKATWSAEGAEPLRPFVNRYRFETPMRGRYLRIRFVGAEGPVKLNSVIAWGDSADGRDGYEDLPPINAGDVMQFTNVTAKGVAILPMGTPRLDEQFKPKGTTPDGVALKMARDEFETRYFAIVNGAETETTVSVAAPDFGSGVTTELLIGGVLPLKKPPKKLSDWDKHQLQTTNDYAVSAIKGLFGIRPFLPADAMPDKTCLRRYFANVDQLADFPRAVTLKPHEGCVVMLRMKTETTTAAGLRKGILTAGDAKLPISLDVVDLTLPQQPWILSSDSEFTAQFPFETRRRFLQDIKRYRESGSTTVQRLPDAGTKEAVFMREVPGAHSVFYDSLWIPQDVQSQVRKGVFSLTNEHLTAKFKASVAAFARRAVGTGYPLDRFIFRTMDEPWAHMVNAAATCGLVMKEAVPGIRVALNPVDWKNGPDGKPCPATGKDLLAAVDWDLYARACDVSCPPCPVAWMPGVRAKIYATNRVNAVYWHPAGCFSATSAYWMHDMGLNAWRYFAYAELHSPEPFDVSKAGHPDMVYTLVYPLEYDVALTPQYEACRECGESIRLIQAVLDAGDRERYKALRKQFNGMVDRTFDRYSTGKPNGKTPTEDGHPDYLAFREKLLEKYSIRK